jgi:hypothetical protein
MAEPRRAPGGYRRSRDFYRAVQKAIDEEAADMPSAGS